MGGRNGLVITMFGALLYLLCKMGFAPYGTDILVSISVLLFSFGLASVTTAILIRIWHSA